MLPRRIRRSLILLVAVLFTQLAVAAYACPELGPAAGYLEGEQVTTLCAAALDAEALQLCRQHYQSDKQAGHHADAPTASVVFVLLYLLPAAAAPPCTAVAAARATYSPLLDRSVEPPVSIRNCCFRT